MGGFSLSIGYKNFENNITVFRDRRQEISYSYSDKLIRLTKYKKILLERDYYIYEDEEHIIAGYGTMSNNGLSIPKGFEVLRRELINKKKINVIGHFCVIFYNKLEKKLHLFFDESGYGAPYVIGQNFICSSFLACCQFASGITLNNAAIFEQVYTGCYLNGTTSFNEIRKLYKLEQWNLPGITVYFIPVIIDWKRKIYHDRTKALESQIDAIREYINLWKSQIIDKGADLGLSSGFDSRLLLAFINEITTNYQVHNYWKKIKENDNIISQKLANVVNKNLIQVPLKDRNEINFNDLLNRAMIYYDGLFPSNHGWVREYRTFNHRLKILDNSQFGLSGLSGEQYRNEYHLLNKSYSIKNIVSNFMLEKDNDQVLFNSKYRLTGLEILQNSLRLGLGIKNERNILSREEIQRYYCEMWVKGGPGIRNQIENQISFFLSPFTDRYLQKRAYDILSFLGFGDRFEADMINLVNPTLAKVDSDYGYSFEKIPLKYEFYDLLNALTGRSIKKKIQKLIMKKNVNYLDTFGPHKEIVENKLESLKKYSFPFTISSPIFQQDTIDRLIALSTLLNHFENKILNDYQD